MADFGDEEENEFSFDLVDRYSTDTYAMCKQCNKTFSEILKNK